MKADIDSRFESHYAYMDSLKEEMDLAHKSLCHERQEYQGDLLDVKSVLQESINATEVQMNEIKYLKSWSYRLNDVLSL